MTSIDSLPPDQRAVLQLVLKRGRGYDDIASMLSIDRASVRQRALDALDQLGPENEIPALERALLTDFLLGQLPPRVAEQVQVRVAGSPAEHAWAQAVSAQLEGLGGAAPAALPALSPSAPAGPAAPTGEPAGSEPSPAASPTAEHLMDEDDEEVADGELVSDTEPSYRDAEPFTNDFADGLGSQAPPSHAPFPRTGRPVPRDQPPRRDRPSARERPSPAGRPAASSRRGGAVLLGVAALIVIGAVIAIIVLTGGSTPKRQPTTTTASTPANQAKLLSTIVLSSPTGKKRATGEAQVIRAAGMLGIVISAAGLPANTRTNAYAVWLYNSPQSSHRVGFVDTRVTRTGLLETDGPLPANAASYKQVLLTLETERNPTQPGTVILSGHFTTVS